MSYEGQRPHMEAWGREADADRRPEEFDRYVAQKNSVSVDGLSAFDARSPSRQG
jgi:hypothetical protein